LGERHDEQEGEEHLHPRYGNPKLVEQFEEFAVELLVAVFVGLGVTLRVTISVFAVRTQNKLLHRPRLHNGPALSTVGMMTPAEVWRILKAEERLTSEKTPSQMLGK
jgi:hypothetical protein